MKNTILAKIFATFALFATIVVMGCAGGGSSSDNEAGGVLMALCPLQ